MPRAASRPSSPSPGPRASTPPATRWAPLLLDRGYTVGSLTLNLTAARETVAAADPGGPGA